MARLKDLTPDCCKNCDRLSLDGGCRRGFKQCAQWRTWFRSEWAKIRRAAEIIKRKEGRK